MTFRLGVISTSSKKCRIYFVTEGLNLLYFLVIFFGLCIGTSLFLFSPGMHTILKTNASLRAKIFLMIGENLKNISDDKVSPEELFKIQPYGYKTLRRFVLMISSYKAVPFLIGMGTALRLGSEALWLFPFDRYIIWDWLMILISIFYIEHNSPLLGMSGASIVGLSTMILIFAADIGIKSKLDHKFSLTRSMFNGLTVLGAYACIYLGISRLYPDSFTRHFPVTALLYYFQFQKHPCHL